MLLAIAIPILAIGVYPNPLLRRIEPAVLEILHQMGRASLPESEAARVAAMAREERE
jgi:NADH:ubiquinone oxidoreductase subunit 4 (subunit M)